MKNEKPTTRLKHSVTIHISDKELDFEILKTQKQRIAHQKSN